MKFTHLHVHSHYSLLDGLAKIDDLVARTKALGMESLALTDHGTLYGAVEFFQKAKKAGIKPIIGCEIYLTNNKMAEKRPDDKRFHLTLLVKDKTGYNNLVQLITKAHLEGFYYKPRVDKNCLKERAEGLICLSGCSNAEIPHLIYSNQQEAAKNAALEYQNIFGKENFYIELQPHMELDRNKKIYPKLLALARELEIPTVATNDAHYLLKEDDDYHDVLLAIGTGNKVSDQNRLTMKGVNLSLRSAEEMEELFKDLPEALENTQKIADACDFEFEFGTMQLPHFELPEGKTTEDYLEELARDGLKRLFGYTLEEAPEVIRERFLFELSVIKRTGFPSYILIVQDFVNWAKERGIVVGPGRGSAAGSLISYLIGITNIDPIKYNLLFERFLNPDRIAPPDIDLDFADHRRDEVIEYVSQKYGRDHVAQIITFGTMAARAAVRDSGRALGFGYTFCDRIAKMIPFAAGMTFAKALEISDELKQAMDTDPQARQLIQTAQKLEGVARHASTHACGVVITKNPITHYMPIQWAAQSNTRAKGRGQALVTQYDMKAVEALGLLKMDFLGLRNLTIIEKALELIEKNYGRKIDIYNVPLDDKNVFELLARADTTGVFQFECLSGDTIVSNTTIKKLAKKNDKKILESIYIDKGKVHKNRILKVFPSGKKEVYTLIAENGWYIKATKNHYFLTEEGWKQLKEINPGTRVLMKTKAKHLIFNECSSCRKQIGGQKEGKSRFCYHCSAKFYKNPSKKESREAIKKAQLGFYERGGVPWNYGATKENNEVWRRTAEKISKALADRTREELMGKERAKEFSLKMSQRMKGEGNPMFGKSSPHRKGGIRPDLGHYVRSNWEADFARILKLYRLQYEYEPKTFRLQRSDGSMLNYTPDFYVPSQDTYYEIKGWMHDLDAEKIQMFQTQYPEKNLVVINSTKFAEFALQYKNLVKWECPRIPVERNFQFVKIEKVKYSGEEETFDIAMEAPGNNFVANGFLVHNSNGMRRYLKELKPTELEDLIVMVAAFRPGPMEFIPTYIARKHGREKVNYLHPKLAPILESTYGVAIYQEQVLKIANQLAGFTIGEADILRKAVGKKIKKLLDEQREKMIVGMINNGIEKTTSEKIWDFIEPFARYGFNRSHAACYALIAYQTAYLKTRYPGEFMTALLNTESFDIDRVAELIEETKRMGIDVLPPDLNESREDFTLIKDSASVRIRFGLGAVKNLGENAVLAIMKELELGRFTELQSFLERIPAKDLNKKSLESLIKCGALDAYGDRKTLYDNIEELLRYSKDWFRSKESPQGGLFGANIGVAPLRLKPTQAATKKEKLGWEKELLGLYISDHPLKEYQQMLEKTAVLINNIKPALNGKRINVGGIISSVQKFVTKAHTLMLFVKIEDWISNIEVIVFPSVLEKTANLWQENNMIMVQGRVSNRDGNLKIICDTARELKLESRI